MEDSKKENKGRTNPHLASPLLVKFDYLALDRYFDLEKPYQADQGEMDDH